MSREPRLRIGEPDDHAAGPTGVVVALKRSLASMGPTRRRAPSCGSTKPTASTA